MLAVLAATPSKRYASGFDNTRSQAQGTIRRPSRSGYFRKTLAYLWAMIPKRPDPELADKYEAEFREQKQRVSNMEVRAVEVTDSVVQAVFEIYAALTLGTTRYNRFDTH